MPTGTQTHTQTHTITHSLTHTTYSYSIETYHELIASDKEIVKSILRLTGSVEGVKSQVCVFTFVYCCLNLLPCLDCLFTNAAAAVAAAAAATASIIPLPPCCRTHTHRSMTT